MKALFTSFFLLMFIFSTYSQSENIEITTKDSIVLSAVYHKPQAIKKPVPAIILIHQGGSSKEEWILHPMWNLLKEQNYALLTFDLRLHGKSGKDNGTFYDIFNNPNRAPRDLKAVINFLTADAQIDPNRIGILGASIGGNLACVASAIDDYSIKSVVSISAKTSAVQNLSGTEEELNFKNAFHIASKEEQEGMREKWAKELYEKTSGKKKIEIGNGDKHGSYILLENPDLNNTIIDWFKETL